MRPAKRAIREAQRLLAQESVREAPVDVRTIAKKHAKVLEIAIDDDVSGMLVPLQKPMNGHYWCIVVNKDHPPARKRFTLAHELGHLLLHAYTLPHADSGFDVRFRDGTSSDGSVIEEIEANRFAAELLMPAELLLERLDEAELEYAPASNDDDDDLARIAREFEVSRQALSIRLATLIA